MRYKVREGYCVFKIIDGGMKSALAYVKQGPTQPTALFDQGDVVVVDDNERIELPDDTVLIHQDKVLAVLEMAETEEEQDELKEFKTQ